MVVAGGLFALQTTGRATACNPPVVGSAGRYQAQKIAFGPVTEYCLGAPSRWANGVAVGPDGSVWFGEQSLPGLGRLMTNGTVVEYGWPGAQPFETGSNNSPRTGIWGVAVWNGKVWGTDSENSLIVGVDPSGGQLTVLNVTELAPIPYTFAASPDGSLWFTSLSDPPKVGRIGPDLSLSYFDVLAAEGFEPLQLEFTNSTAGYLVGLTPSNPGGEQGLYRFNVDPGQMDVRVAKVGGLDLSEPDSVSSYGRFVWVAQHGPSSIVRYDTDSRTWTVFPLAKPSYTGTTLPYFVEAQSSQVWFNEHFANRVGMLDPISGTSVEFSESDPPPESGSQVQNDLTIAATQEGVWFTSMSGGYVGFVGAGANGPFSLSVAGGNEVELARGVATSVQVDIAASPGSGSWPAQGVIVTDSENKTSVPRLLSAVSSETSVPAGSGEQVLTVQLTAASNLPAGRYTVGVTLTDGLIFETVYLFVTVT